MGLLTILEIIACGYAGGWLARDAGYRVPWAVFVCVVLNLAGLAAYFVLWALRRKKGATA